MTDVTHTLLANSDQLNASDLIAGSIVVRIDKVDVKRSKDQPITIHIGEDYQPYKPGLTCRRILSVLWGKDSKLWVGRWLRLYCDPNVKWNNQEAGGIRISHASHIDEEVNVTVRSSKYGTKKYLIKPIEIEKTPYPDESIKKNSEGWKNLFLKNKTTPQDLINKIQQEHTLTHEQISTIEALNIQPTENKQDQN